MQEQFQAISSNFKKYVWFKRREYQISDKTIKYTMLNYGVIITIMS